VSIFVVFCFSSHVFPCVCIPSICREVFGVVLIPRQTFYQRVNVLAGRFARRRKILYCVKIFTE
jgi:hypothetical protein